MDKEEDMKQRLSEVIASIIKNDPENGKKLLEIIQDHAAQEKMTKDQAILKVKQMIKVLEELGKKYKFPDYVMEGASFVNRQVIEYLEENLK